MKTIEFVIKLPDSTQNASNAEAGNDAYVLSGLFFLILRLAFWLFGFYLCLVWSPLIMLPVIALDFIYKTMGYSSYRLR
jgi:hypothetical protein